MRVAIIGAGVSGLTSIKICRDYGLDVICFEKSPKIGGLWSYKNEIRPGEGSVMKSTVSISSKEMMAFSDFPPSKDSPCFMHHEKVLEYIKCYADHFGLVDYIRFQCEVISVKRSKNYEKTGQWDITYRNLRNGNTLTETYDAVFMANGHHNKPFRDHFPGLEKFKGRVIHSQDYREPSFYEKKRVLVVGIGDSGGDIAAELSGIASQVYLVNRNGNWCLPRMIFGIPYDMRIQKRIFAYFLHRYFPSFANYVVEFSSNYHFNHETFHMKGQTRVMNQRPLINEVIQLKFFSGHIVLKPNVIEFCEKDVLFENNTVVENLDEVIMCTGYSLDFPMLENNLIQFSENGIELYKMIFPPKLCHHTLAFIGLIQPWGSAVMPVSEMQARYACEVLTGQIKLPETLAMLKSIKTDKDRRAKRYGTSRKYAIEIDYLKYVDDLGEIIGVKPKISDYIFSDPKLAYQIACGPVAAYQYRLKGRHSWQGARNAVLTVWDRAFCQVKQGRKYVRKGNFLVKTLDYVHEVVFAILGVIVLLFIWFVFV